MNGTEVVRAFYEAFRRTDVAAAAPLVATTFVFTSPQDDHLDRDTYLQRCFPTAGHFKSQDFLVLTDIPGTDHVVLVYEYELHDGSRYRNAELITVARGQITEVQVFFGGRV